MAIEADLVRELLSEIVKSKPDIRGSDHKWLLAMLKDLYNPMRQHNHSDCYKEMNGIANCLEWGTVQLIKNSYCSKITRSEAKIILHELVHDYGLQEELSRWCIESWCLALGKSFDLESREHTNDNTVLSKEKTVQNSTTGYSEQIFKQYVDQKLNAHHLNIDLKMDLTVKGKQLGLSDILIKSIINNTNMQILKEKHPVTAKSIYPVGANTANQSISTPIDRSAWKKNGGWTMFGGNVYHNRRSPFQGPSSNQLKWTHIAGFGGYISLSSPAIDADGSVYFGGYDNKLYSIDPNGNLKWTFQTGKTNKGLLSSPAIGINGTVYIGSFDKNIYAISPKGKLIWAFPTNDWVRSSPAVGPDGTIYIGSYDYFLYAIDKFGTLKWRFPSSFQIWSSPAIGDDGTIYFCCLDRNVYALKPDGSLKWKCDIGCDGNSSVAIGSDNTIYASASDNRFFALSPFGNMKWVFKPKVKFTEMLTDHGFSCPAIGLDNSVYVGNRDKNFYAIYPDGSLNWSIRFDAPLVSSPAIDALGSIYIGCNDNKLHALNANGNYLWTVETSDVVISSPAIGEDGTVYFGSMDGTLNAVGPGKS